MRRVAGHHGQVVDQRGGGDLLVDRILRIRYTQAAPDLRRVRVEGQKPIRVVIYYPFQPALESVGLCPITAMADTFNTPSQLADRDDRHKKRGILTHGVVKEGPSSRVGFLALAWLADDVRIDEVHALVSPDRLLAGEILIFADVRHARQDFSEMTSPRTKQRGAKYLAVLLLGAAVVLRGALLQGFDEIVWQITNHELCHSRGVHWCTASNASKARRLQAMLAVSFATQNHKISARGQ